MRANVGCAQKNSNCGNSLPDKIFSAIRPNQEASSRSFPETQQQHLINTTPVLLLHRHMGFPPSPQHIPFPTIPLFFFFFLLFLFPTIPHTFPVLPSPHSSFLSFALCFLSQPHFFSLLSLSLSLSFPFPLFRSTSFSKPAEFLSFFFSDQQSRRTTKCVEIALGFQVEAMSRAIFPVTGPEGLSGRKTVQTNLGTHMRGWRGLVERERESLKKKQLPIMSQFLCIQTCQITPRTRVLSSFR